MNHAEQETAVGELETRLERLRALYDQYFMGFEKMEPMVPRKDLDRRIFALRKEQIRNTGLRFKFNQLTARYVTLATHWGRILRQIEKGTYKRDLMKAQKRFGAVPLTEAARRRAGLGRSIEEIAAGAAPKTEAITEDDFLEAEPDDEPLEEADDDVPTPPRRALPVPTAEPTPPPAPVKPVVPARPEKPRPAHVLLSLDDDDLDMSLTSGPPSIALRAPAAPKPAAPAAKPAAPAAKVDAPKPNVEAPTPPQPPKPAPKTLADRPAAPVPGLTEARVREIYGKYVDERRKNNESTAAVTLEGISRSLRESGAKLRDKHQGKNIDFEVVVRDGKTVLKPIVK